MKIQLLNIEKSGNEKELEQLKEFINSVFPAFGTKFSYKEDIYEGFVFVSITAENENISQLACATSLFYAHFVNLFMPTME